MKFTKILKIKIQWLRLKILKRVYDHEQGVGDTYKFKFLLISSYFFFFPAVQVVRGKDRKGETIQYNPIQFFL